MKLKHFNLVKFPKVYRYAHLIRPFAVLEMTDRLFYFQNLDKYSNCKYYAQIILRYKNIKIHLRLLLEKENTWLYIFQNVHDCHYVAI